MSDSTTPAPILPLTIISGLSGSGKTTALKAFEDCGGFCIDNVPVTIMPELVRSMIQSPKSRTLKRLVLGIDARSGDFFEDWEHASLQLKKLGIEPDIVYLESSDEVLIRRFSESRRRHPLALADIHSSMTKERELLQPLRAQATMLVDSSNTNVHQLRAVIMEHMERMHGSGAEPMLVTLLSFGFKYGVPLEADLLFDARFLPNPHFVPELRAKTGNDLDVYNFVMNHEETKTFLHHMTDLLDFCLPRFVRERKAYLTIAVGCTGGKHRSVSLARALAEHLNNEEGRFSITTRHRDVGKE